MGSSSPGKVKSTSKMTWIMSNSSGIFRQVKDYLMYSLLRVLLVDHSDDGLIIKTGSLPVECFVLNWNGPKWLRHELR